MLTSKSDSCIGPKHSRYVHSRIENDSDYYIGSKHSRTNESSKRIIKSSSNGSLSSLSDDDYLLNSSSNHQSNESDRDVSTTQSDYYIGPKHPNTNESDDDYSLQSTNQDGHSSVSESLESLHKDSISSSSSSSNKNEQDEQSSLKNHHSSDDSVPDSSKHYTDSLSESSDNSVPDSSKLYTDVSSNQSDENNDLKEFVERNENNPEEAVSSDTKTTGNSQSNQKADSSGTECDHIHGWTEARTENETLSSQSYYPGKYWKYDYDEYANRKQRAKDKRKENTSGWEKQPSSGYTTWGVGKSWYGQPTSGRAHDKNMQQYADQESYQDDQNSYDPQNEYPDQQKLQYADQESYQDDHSDYDHQNEIELSSDQGDYDPRNEPNEPWNDIEMHDY